MYVLEMHIGFSTAAVLNLFVQQAGWAVPSPSTDQIQPVVPIWHLGQAQEAPSGCVEGGRGQPSPMEEEGT